MREARGAIRCLATFDATRRYRYRLMYDWGGSRRRVAFIMLNPSTADEHVLDPTIRRCIGFAKRWGFEGIDVVNLFAWRSTDPSALAQVADPIGPDNDRAIRDTLRRSSLAVAAWGADTIAQDRSLVVECLAAGLRTPLFCLATTTHGHPRHPLYVAAAAALRPYRAAS